VSAAKLGNNNAVIGGLGNISGMLPLKPNFIRKRRHSMQKDFVAVYPNG
jgi:hypothetical protein